jgi:Ca2+-binding RTX toxin-like protein
MSTWRPAYEISNPANAASPFYREVIGDMVGVSGSRALVAYGLDYLDTNTGLGSQGIYLRWLDPFGNPLPQETFVASTLYNTVANTGSLQSAPDITLLQGGDILVTWNERPRAGGVEVWKGRVLAPDGTPQAAVFDIPIPTVSHQKVEFEAHGTGFDVITRNNGVGGTDVRVRSFSSAGVEIGTAFDVAGPGGGYVRFQDGTGITAWASGNRILAQKVDAVGQFIGNAVVIATGAAQDNFNNFDLQLEALNNGDIAVVFSGSNSNTFNYSSTYTMKIGSDLTVLNASTNLAIYDDYIAGPQGFEVDNGPRPGTYYLTYMFDNGYDFMIAHSGGVKFVNEAGVVTSEGGFNSVTRTPEASVVGATLEDGRFLAVMNAGLVRNDNRAITQGLILDNRTGVLNGDSASNVILGRTGTAGDVNDVIWGRDGNDSLYGMLGNDTIDAGNGDDVVAGNEGNDVLVLGAGNDYGYTGTNTVQDYAYGGDGNDVLVGDTGAIDILLGDAGNDTIYGGTGTYNYLFSGTGNNVLVGGATQVDVFYSEGTSDFVQAAQTYSLTYRLAAGDMQLIGGTGVDQFIGGTSLSNDSVVGGAGNDYLYGGGGNDVLSGGDGNDVIIGQNGNDTLEGGSGINLLWANDAGNDQILVNIADGGTQVVDFFEAGGTNDVVRLLGSSLTSFAGIQNLVANIGVAQGANLLVNAGFGAQLYLNLGANQTAIWFQGVSAYSLTSADFLFV